MSPAINRNNDVLTDAKGSDNFADKSSSDGVIARMFSPLRTFKNVVSKPKRSSMVGGCFPKVRRVNELKQDNCKRLSGLMKHCNDPAMVDEIDESFLSDFDESARWVKQIEENQCIRVPKL